MTIKACEICKHSVTVKYGYKGYSWEKATKESALFCIAAPPLQVTSAALVSVKLANVTTGRDKLKLYKRYLEVSDIAPCSLFEQITQKRKITE